MTTDLTHATGSTPPTARPHRPVALTLCTGVVVLLAVAVLAPALLGAGDPNATDPLAALLPPSADHWFGTDELGRDLYARVVHGARYSVLIALAAVALGLSVGTVTGLLAALARRWLGELLTRVLDLLSAFPSILLALLFATFAGAGSVPLSLAIGIALVPGFARIVRRQTLAIRRSEFVVAAVTLGAGRAAVVVRHVLPNVFSSVLLLAAIEVGTSILTVSGLSFVGLGPQRPTPEWGALLAEGRSVINHGWWPTVFPGLALVVTIVAVTTLGRYAQHRTSGRGTR